MRLHNLAYLCKQGAKNIFNNKLMSFACIGVLVACLLMIGSAALFTLTVNNVASDVEKQNELVIFLQEDASLRDIKSVERELQSLDNILEYNFISKQEWLENFKETAGDSAVLFNNLEDDQNPLADSYSLIIKDSALMAETMDALTKIPKVEKVNGSREVAEILVSLKQTVYYVGVTIVIILIAVSIAIITNTIKLTIFNRRKEINIMKYVGATDTFIQFPFIIEGILIGLLAAVLAFLLLSFGYTYLIQYARENYGEFLNLILVNAVDFRDIAIYFLLGFSGIGVFIGVMGSGLFVRKYLRV